MSEALKQHDAGELVQQNRAEARVNVGLSCLEKQPRRRRREPFLLLASNNPHAQWYFRASARYATLFLERRQVVLLPLSCLPRPIRTNSHHDISSCVLPAGAHIMVHILRELPDFRNSQRSEPSPLRLSFPRRFSLLRAEVLHRVASERNEPRPETRLRLLASG